MLYLYTNFKKPIEMQQVQEPFLQEMYKQMDFRPQGVSFVKVWGFQAWISIKGVFGQDEYVDV
jgi:hypothetical protein